LLFEQRPGQIYLQEGLPHFFLRFHGPTDAVTAAVSRAQLAGYIYIMQQSVNPTTARTKRGFC